MGLFSKLKKLRLRDIGTGRNLKRIGQGLKQMKFGEGLGLLGGWGMMGGGPLGFLGGIGKGASGFGKNLFGKAMGGGEGGGFFSGLGKNLFGLQGGQAGMGGLGFGMQTLGQLGQMFPQQNTAYEQSLNQSLNPLQQSADKLGDIGQQYMDPNSSLNQQMRNQIRTQNMEGFSDILDRNRNMATGVYSPESTGVMNQGMMSDAISKALGAHSKGLGDMYKTGAGFVQQQGTLNNALSQAMLRNKLLAQQQQAMPWQMLGQTGTGLMNRAFQQPQQQQEITIE